MKGSCYCESVTFEIDLDRIEAYHCHCSICRKVTGSKFNTAFITEYDNFKWTSSTDTIRTYRKIPTGFRHDFCSECGCTVPNAYKNDTMFWVPVGLLDDSDAIRVVKHIFVDSRASWDSISDDLEQFSEFE